MQSFLITNGNEQTRLEKAEEIIGRKISALGNDPDFFLLQAEESSIGIEEIRNLQKKLTLKPFSGNQKICLILEAQNLTLEAQNSFLKTLEEPPKDTKILLSLPEASLLIPTVVSRCQLINLSPKIEQTSNEEEKKIIDFIEKMITLSSGQRLKEIEKEEFLKDRQLAIEWLDKLIFMVRKNMLEHYRETPNYQLLITNYSILFRLLNCAKSRLSSNCNVRLVVENFLLDLPYKNQ